MKGPTNSNFGYAKNVSCWNCSLNYSQNRFWFWDKRDVKGKYHFRCWKSFVREFRKLLRMLPLRGRTSKSQRLCATAGTTIQQAWQKIVKGMFFQAWKENIPWKDMRKKRPQHQRDWLHSFILFLFFFCRNAGINELQNLKYLPRSSTEREIFFEDRTPAHADHVGFGLERITTAAVGKPSTYLLTLVAFFNKGKSQNKLFHHCFPFRCLKGHSLRNNAGEQ